MAESSPSSTIPVARRASIDRLIDLKSSTGPLSEELQCSVCLDVFTDPVAIPCGHSFCKSCLIQCWEKNEVCYCPLCKETFSRRPELKINTALRQVVHLFKEKSERSAERCDLTRSDVLCDICGERKEKALKSCLICQSSYCETHLEPHQRVPRLTKHKLINAVGNLEDYICQKHERPLEMFCRDDQMSVCLSCLDGDHRNHNTVPLEEESVEKKACVLKLQKDVQQMIQDRVKKIEDVKVSAKLRNHNMEKEKADGLGIFTALMLSIEKCQAELLEMMEQKKKAAEKQDEQLIEDLQQEITELQRRDCELEQISHTEDHLHLIQSYPSLSRTFNSKKWPDVNVNVPLRLETLRKALTDLQKTLDETEFQRMRVYAVNVTLDPDTAHPNLILSANGKEVICGDTELRVPDNPKRFKCYAFVLGKEGFSSGRFYFEVQVKNKTEWTLGVARESVKRKGIIKLTPQDGYWGIFLRNGKDYEALANPSVSLHLRVKPQQIGVFVDYEEGLVSFYDVESRSHIYSFTGQTFTEKLYPNFCPGQNTDGKNSAPLIISPVKCTK